MLGLNKAYFIGRVGRDPELKTSGKGTSFTHVTIAVPNRKQQDDGSWLDSPDWHRLVAFGKTAEWIVRDARKGDAIAVECVIRHKKWNDKDGQTHYETSILVEQLLWHMRKAGTTASVPVEDPRSPVAGLPTQIGPIGATTEEELPF